MRKLMYLVLTVAIGLVMTTFAIIGPVSAQVDFDAYRGAAIPDGSIDGVIGTEWDDAGNYTGVLIDPEGAAKVWTKHDGTYLYIAIQYDADSNNSWLALQLDTTSCMGNTSDVVIFGDDNLAPDGYSDALYQGMSVTNDTAQNGTQDGVGAMTVDSQTQLVTIELKKPLNSSDSDGQDIAWSEGNTYDLVIAWDSDGGGSSGGGRNHRSSGPTARSILIDPQVIPEFPGWSFIVVLIAVGISFIILIRKTVLTPTRTTKL